MPEMGAAYCLVLAFVIAVDNYSVDLMLALAFGSFAG